MADGNFGFQAVKSHHMPNVLGPEESALHQNEFFSIGRSHQAVVKRCQDVKMIQHDVSGILINMADTFKSRWRERQAQRLGGALTSCG